MWNNCEEGQPKKYGQYLCCIAQIGGFTISVMTWREGNYWTDVNYAYVNDDVSHWMELPELPERDSSSKQGGLGLFAALR